MSNNEIFINDVKYLRDLGVNITIYQDLTNTGRYVLEMNERKVNFNAQELKDYLNDLKKNIDDLETTEAKKRTMFRHALLEASEEVARRFSKQVFTLSIGEANE